LAVKKVNKLCIVEERTKREKEKEKKREREERREIEEKRVTLDIPVQNVIVVHFF
jgi:hypothetical protein